MTDTPIREFSPKNLSELLDADWRRFHEFGGVQVPIRRFLDNFSPRFAHIFLLRVAQRLWFLGFRRMAKLFSLMNVVFFGLEVPARLDIGPGLVIPHPNGIILGAGYVGSDVTLFQQVTLGASLVDFAYTPELRPWLDDGVIVTAGAKILGGVKIGSQAVVGANAVVLSDVPPGALAVGVPARIKVRKIVDLGS